MLIRKVFAALCGVLLAVAVAMASLSLIVDGLGSSAPLMHALMRRYTTPVSTGLPQEHYQPMAIMITDYLSGRAEEFQYTYTDGEGVTYLCFREHEQQHMQDVRGLFVLARQAMVLSVLGMALLGGCAWLMRAQKKRVLRGFLWGLGGVLALLAALIVWGAADFDGLFVLFHRLSFDNELWLLNPQTDLLIRLMPTGFFLHYGVILGGTWLGLLVAMAAIVRRSSKEVKTK